MRMYLSTANQFTAYVALGASPWSAAQIERFLVEHRGARNNLSRFVSFCRRSKEWDVAMPAKKGAALAPIKDPLATSKKLAELITKVEASGIEHANRMMLQKILATALGIPLNAIKGLSAEQFESSDAGLLMQVEREKIMLPSELLPYGEKLLRFLQ